MFLQEGSHSPETLGPRAPKGGSPWRPGGGAAVGRGAPCVCGLRRPIPAEHRGGVCRPGAPREATTLPTWTHGLGGRELQS